jgi:hypothetical protein
MASSQAQGLTTAQQLASLRLHRFFSTRLATTFSQRSDVEAREFVRGEDTAIRAWSVAPLAWELAISAQSCAYLAESLQLMAEKCAHMQIVCRGSTYNQLYDSLETFLALIDTMLGRLGEQLQQEDVNEIPRLSSQTARVIRLSLVAGRAITTVGSMISTESQETMPTNVAGDTR